MNPAKELTQAGWLNDIQVSVIYIGRRSVRECEDMGYESTAPVTDAARLLLSAEYSTPSLLLRGGGGAPPRGWDRSLIWIF